MNVDSPEILAACAQLGWTKPRPAQVEALTPLLQGEDVLAVLPTSMGKSALFQLPALAREGLVVVISPLVALMADQVDRLRNHGINAWMLNSHCSTVQKKKAMEEVREGRADLLYISPERLQGLHPSFFGNAKVQLFAIDEAHCISEWGHDFRPAYLKVGRSLDRFGEVQKIALTATATSDVVMEIAQILGINDSYRIVHSPNRSNITYGVAGKKVNLVRLVQSGGLPSLVYGSTRKSVENGARELQRAGFSCGFYHAGMKRADRVEVQRKFTDGEYEVITATCAFGMGIDHPGIRSVIHLEMPTSLEAYMQESGRAGRDGSPSIALCRATVDTLDVAGHLVGLTWPTPGRIKQFWREIQYLFTMQPGKWEGENRLQLTNEHIALKLDSFQALEVGSCIRILHNCGVLQRVSYQDRPVSVSLLSQRHHLTGSRQKTVIRALEEHADTEGKIVGSVRFFRDIIGLDKSFARALNLRNAIQFDWVDRCQMLEIVADGGDLELDEGLINEIRRRSLYRIQASREFLKNSGCRRRYLLEYFGDTSGGKALGRCCDRCISDSNVA
jgi:ATP-dependent DNA helicase RecQ